IQDAARRMFAKPTAVAILRPQSAAPGDVRPANARAAAINDSFSGRVPTGRVVEAQWVRDALAKGTSLSSRVAPVSFTLPNGLRLLVQETHDNPTVSISGRVRNSPRADPPGKEGLSGFLGSMMSYGSRKYSFEE